MSLLIGFGDRGRRLDNSVIATPTKIKTIPVPRVSPKLSAKIKYDAMTPAQGANNAKGATMTAGYVLKSRPQIANATVVAINPKYKTESILIIDAS